MISNKDKMQAAIALFGDVPIMALTDAIIALQKSMVEIKKSNLLDHLKTPMIKGIMDSLEVLRLVLGAKVSGPTEWGKFKAQYVNYDE